MKEKRPTYRAIDILGEDPPLVIVECACGANTVARTPISITLENWRVEWPEQTFKMMRVRGVCPKCLNRQA